MNRLPSEGTGVMPSGVTALENPQVRLPLPQHSPLKDLCSSACRLPGQGSSPRLGDRPSTYLGQVRVTLMAPPPTGRQTLTPLVPFSMRLFNPAQSRAGWAAPRESIDGRF